MQTYLQVTGIMFHVIVGGILFLSVAFYWITRDTRKSQKKSLKDLELAIEDQNKTTSADTDAMPLH